MVSWIKTISSEELGWPAVWKNVLQPDVTFPVSRSSTASQLCLFHITNTLLPTHLLFIYFTSPPRQVAACLSTSPLNWAAWMLNCMWHVRFLMKALFYCRVCSLQFHFDRGGMSTKEKTQPPKVDVFEGAHMLQRHERKKHYFFVCFVCFLGEFQDIHLPFGMSRNVFF